MHSSDLDDFRRRFRRLVNPANKDVLLYYLFVFHFLFLVMQIQHLPLVNLLGVIRLPAIITIVVSVLSLPYVFKVSHTFLFKVFFIFLLIEAVRGFVGFYVMPDLVVNDKHHFETWKLLLSYFTSLVIPFLALYSNGKSLRDLTKIFVVFGTFFGLWSMSHSGFGLGGYLEDENDHCLFLLGLMPFVFLVLKYSNFFVKIACFFSALVMIGGVIYTDSRGGYLGFFSLIGVYFYLSRNKLIWIFFAFIMSVIVLPFVPSKFWTEVESIYTESKQRTGTINERIETWGYVTRMWLDPKNTLFGVGLENLKWRIGDYEGSQSGVTQKSLAGRAAHSFYFQVLGDLGAYGVLIFGSLLVNSLILLNRVRVKNRLLVNKLKLILKSLKVQSSEESDHSSDNLLLKKKSAFIKDIIKELDYLGDFSRTVIISWVGMQVAALGISVAYYPPFWLFCSISVVSYLYFRKLSSVVLMLERQVKKNVV